MVAGLGSGKTHAVARKAIALMIANPGFDGIVTEPNYPLLVQILVPELIEALEYFEIQFKYNKADNIFYCNIGGKQTRVLCKSMESYERLIGVNAAWVIMDEYDTTKADIAYTAYLKLLGRMRVGNVRQMVIVSTPEGFKAMYRIFIAEDDDSKRLIKAKTTDNKHLPVDYIDSLLATYPAELIEAYMDGEFVNLTSGTVYRQFDRDRCGSTETIKEKEPLYIGQDFNVGNMTSTIFVKRGNISHAVGEITGELDTPSLCDTLTEKYPSHKIIMYPDASGKNKSSKGASVTDISLLKLARFNVRAKNKNPLVKDRVLSMNTAFSKGLVKVNVDECPELTKALEQQAYDKNGEPDKSTGHDHAADSCGYFVYYEYPVNKPAIEAKRLVGMH